MIILFTPPILSALAWVFWLVYWLAASKGASESKWKESWLGRAQHFVPIFIGFHFLYGRHPFFPARVIPESLAWPALGLQISGMLLMVWARIHLGKEWSGNITVKVDHQFIFTGPYRWIRHPIYTGFLIGALGAFFCLGRIGGLIGVLLMLTSFSIKLLREEKVMKSLFGIEYEQYIRDTWRLIPWIW